MIPAMKLLTLLTTLVLMQTMSLLASPIEQIPIKDIDGKDIVCIRTNVVKSVNSFMAGIM